jgi:dimethylamine--corrinoid protein Co-methyltransferase
MGGLRTAGDLVARAQMSKKLKIADAKAYVARKLGTDLETMTDECAMKELREKLDIGGALSSVGYAKGMAAKARIAALCDFEIDCVKRFFEKTKPSGASSTSE